MADDAKAPAPFELERDVPKDRFIRTLETDTAALKAGGKPDFTRADAAPVARAMETPEDALSRAVAARSSDTIDVDMQGPREDFSRLGTIPENPSVSASSRLVGGSSLGSIPALTADLTPITPTAPAPVVSRPLAPASMSPLHTYTSDFDTAVKQQGATPATILAAEQDAARKASPVEPPSVRRNNYIFISGAVLFVLLGGGGAYYAYTVATAPTTVAVAPQESIRIFVDERAQVAGSGSELAAAIMKSTQQALASGGVRLLTLADGTTTNASVFSALQLPAPDMFLRNTNSAQSLAGIVNANGTQSPFFILSVQDYGETFAGLLSWEPRMFLYIDELYPLYPASMPAISTTTVAAMNTATSSATSTPPIVTPVAPAPLTAFRDEVVANHDTRVLRDTAGHTLVIYGYWDQHTLVIARDEAAFIEIVGRLANSRTQQ